MLLYRLVTRRRWCGVTVSTAAAPPSQLRPPPLTLHKLQQLEPPQHWEHTDHDSCTHTKCTCCCRSQTAAVVAAVTCIAAGHRLQQLWQLRHVLLQVTDCNSCGSCDTCCCSRSQTAAAATRVAAAGHRVCSSASTQTPAAERCPAPHRCTQTQCRT